MKKFKLNYDYLDEKLISVETARLAKDKGVDFVMSHFVNRFYHKPIKNINGLGNFDCDRWGTNVHPREDFVGICTQSSLHKYLREKQNIVINVFTPNLDKNKKWYFELQTKKGSEKDITNYETYEVALENGLKKALTLL